MAKKQTATLPKVSILDRRLLNPFGSPSVGITLKTPGNWEVRWVNSKIRAGRLHEMTRNKGWEFIEPDELMGSPDEYGLTAKDNRLVRGDHGEEVLMKMPSEMYAEISRAKREYNLGQLGKKKMADAAAQQAAVEHGSEAGDGVFNAFKHGDVIDSREAREEESA